MATYARQELVGRGGMAEVWRGQMTTDGGATRTVALKFILPKLADDAALLTAFRSEAQLSMHLSHGNVVQVFDFGQLEERWFLAMEWIDGTSLWKVLKKAKALGLGAVHPVMAAQVLMAVLDGLHHAHTRSDDGKPLKLVHRDISPDNVLLSWDGQVKVADFGIARAAMQGRQETQPGIFKGKLAYGAPEQARAEAVDARADVYAAGVMLWELVTGHNPVAENAVGIAAGRASIAAFDPRLVDEPFATLINKAVAAEPNARFPSAKAFRDALASWLRSQPATRMGPAELMAWLFPDQVSAPELKDAAAGTGQWLLRWKPKATQPQLEPEPVTTRIDAPKNAPPLRAVLGISIGVILAVSVLLLATRAKPSDDLRTATTQAAAQSAPEPIPMSVEPARPNDPVAEARLKIAALDFEGASLILEREAPNRHEPPQGAAEILLRQMDTEWVARFALLTAEKALDAGELTQARGLLSTAAGTRLLQDKLIALTKRADEAAANAVPTRLAAEHPKGAVDAEALGERQVSEATALAKAGQLRAAKKKIDECRRVAPAYVRCVLISGSIYAQLSAVEFNDPMLLKAARGFYEQFVKEACPGNASCRVVQKMLESDGPARGAKSGGGAREAKKDDGVLIMAPTMMGAVDKDQVVKVFDANRSQLERCWKSTVNRPVDSIDKVLVKFVISATGAVAASQRSGSTVGNAELEACVVELVRTWQFPKPRGGGVAIVSVPVNFANLAD